MKVYIVVQEGHEHHENKKVFSSRYAADEYCEHQPADFEPCWGGLGGLDVEEFEVEGS
jgi:hypothetical protein